MNRRLQCLSLFFLPFFLSAILLLVYLQARSRLETTRKDQGRESWGREAKSALTHLEAGHTIESQIDTMGIGLNERLRRLWGWSGLSDSDLAGQELVEAFRLAFPARHRPVGTLLYGFKVDERGRVVFLRGKKLSVGLGQGRERILAGLLEGFLAMGKDDGRARENSPGGGILSPAMLGSRCRGLFGRKVTPGLVGVEGRGRLVPVEMGGVSREPGFLLWNFIGFQGGNVGGYVIFFPRNLSRQARPLSFCLEKIARESGGRLLPMLVPVNPLLPLRKALIHPDCRKIPGLREFLARMLPYVDRESAFPVNRLFLGEGVWAMRRFFSLDRPYEGWVVGRDPLARAPVMKNRRQVAWLVFLGAWGLILSPFLIRGTVPEISIRRTFPLFFFLVAAVPLAMRFSLESHQIEAGRFRQVAEMGDAALDEIRGVDGEFSEVISDFTQDSRALLSRPGWLARLASVDPGVECEAASEAFRIFSSSTIRLDLLLVYKPGKIPRGYSTDPELSRRDRTGLDFFAPAGQEIIRRCELDRPSGQIFPLSENQ